jgi:hypothetical protein
MKVTVEDSGSSIILKVAPRIEDLAGIAAGKISVEKALELLDKMRSEEPVKHQKNMREKQKGDIMSFAGAMKNEKQKLELLKSKIAAEREAN